MTKALTVASVERIGTPAKRLEVPDAVLPGLFLIVQPSGAKSWALRYRHRGMTRKLTIGRYPVFELGEARAKAREALQAVAAGRDPCGELRERRRAAMAVDPDHDLVSVQVENFLARHVRKTSKAANAADVERRFRKYVLPHWSRKRVQEVSRRDVIELLDGIVDSGAGITANRTLATLKTFFTWLVDRSAIEQSPCARVKPPAPETSRDRVLSDDEIRLLWKVADDLGVPYGAFLKVLLLTAQRRDEVAQMTRAELVAPDLWTLPAERSKNGLAHDVPLSGPVAAILSDIPQTGSRGYLFTISGQQPFTAYSDVKRRVDARMAALNGGPVPGWTFHDARRTAASGMARLGIAVNVIESVLNHRSGQVSGVAGIYNRYAYQTEMRRALEAWGGHVMGLVGEPAASNVAAIRAAP